MIGWGGTVDNIDTLKYLISYELRMFAWATSPDIQVLYIYIYFRKDAADLTRFICAYIGYYYYGTIYTGRVQPISVVGTLSIFRNDGMEISISSLNVIYWFDDIKKDCDI